jgi:group I intron endonuclease
MVKQQWGCIYRLTNTDNGKKYIGKTIEFKNRMNSHKNSKDECYIHRAIRKYGWNTFKVEKIIDNVPEEDLNNLEISYIAVETTKRPNGYNLTDGGEGVSGYSHTEESRKKMSEIQKLVMSNRHQFGTIHFHKCCNKWRVRSARPQKSIGLYLTKEKAMEALNHYNLTGECMPSDRSRRKKGTGTINKRNGKYEAKYKKNKKTKSKTFDTKEECENWLKIMYNN